MIHVIATIQVHPGRREELLAAFAELVPTVLAEQGCLRYETTVEVPTTIPVQETLGPDVVVMVEQWASLEALEAHLMAPHMNAFRTAVKPFVQQTTLRVLQSADV